MQHGELRSCRGSRRVNEFFHQFSSFNFNDTFKIGEALFHIFYKLVFFTKYNSNSKWNSNSRKIGSNWKWYLSSACVKFQCWWLNGAIRCWPSQPKTPKIKWEGDRDRTGTPVVCRLGSRKFWNPGRGCKSSGKIWWMMKFQYMETLTPVLPMTYFHSPHSRDVRIWVSTVVSTHFS